MGTESHRERRRLSVEDENLTPQANRILSEELRDAVDADEVETPARRPPARSPTVAKILAGRFLLATVVGAAVVIGALLAVTGGSWILFGVAIGVLLAALGAMVLLALQTSTEAEHPRPEAVARLEAEGVANPEQELNDRLQEYASSEPRRPLRRTLAKGDHRRTRRPEDDPARAFEEQQTGVTPSSDRSVPAPRERRNA
jgi:hypothetical protein